MAKTLPKAPDIKVRARELRRSPTSAERFFWFLVRKRRLNGVKFRRQHPWRRYILDFFAGEVSVAVEFDGIFHDDSGDYDSMRDAVLASNGILTLRFANEELFCNPELVLEKVWSAVEFAGGCRDAPPALRAPSPLMGEGV